MSEFVHWRSWLNEGEEWVVLSTPFNKDYIEELKRAVPGSMRRWLPELRAWRIHESCARAATTVVGNYFSARQLCPVCIPREGALVTALAADLYDRMRGGNPLRCQEWARFAFKTELYERNEGIRQREYLRNHPKTAKNSYGKKLFVDGDQAADKDSGSDAPRYKRVMDFD